jgi:hypothetical protein
MEAYRAPYPNRERSLPTLVWPRERPIEGEPADVVALAEANAKWLIASTNLPKLTVGASSFPPPAKALQSVELAHGVLFTALQESYRSTHENTSSVA